MTYVIGVDVGSQSVKGLLLDGAGRVRASAAAELKIAHPRPAEAEQDPDDWTSALATVVHGLVRTGGIDGGEVTALNLACQVDGVVAMDAAGTALAPAIIWLDRRAERQTEALLARVGADRLFAITGLMPDSSHTAPKILWLREHLPEVYARAAAFPPAAGYLLFQLTGVLALDHANASSSLLYDVTARAWSAELLAAAELSEPQLGAIHEATDVVGTLTPGAAADLGLSTRCRVLVGTGDDHAGSIGAGVIAPGPVADVTGTAEPVAVCAAEPVFDDGLGASLAEFDEFDVGRPDDAVFERGGSDRAAKPGGAGLVETHAHAVPGRYLVENPGFVSGGSTLWLARNVLGVSQGEVLDLAGEAPVGSDGLLFLPALSGSMAPRWNGRMRGVFAGLSMAHDRAALARSVLEGCGFALRDITDRFAALGLGTGEIHVVGGGGRCRTWMQIKADVTGRPVRAVDVPEATVLGAALLAAVAAGIFRDLDEAVRHSVRLAAETYEPDPRAQAVYGDAYGRYRALFDGVEEALT
ncbi:MAG TPA: FGGY family carbohydrate kinase [Pseudonocardia sp.]|nr:FGGY family carbohydrate kinase [Pseudonocardia sp.]